MVTSIVLTGMFNIGISSTGKIKTPDGVTVALNDIPFVRYRFEQYGEKELAFIKENKQKFPCVHIVELALNEETFKIIDTLDDMDDSIGKIIYVDVTDKEVIDGFSDSTIKLLNDLSGYDFDRLSIRDKSDTLFPLALNRLKKQIKEAYQIKEDDIGVCGGPCCFTNGNACLTALKARELLEKYSMQDDVVVPSANHEGKIDNADNMESCTNKCGCIRYHVYSKDVAAPSGKSQSSDGNKKITVNVEGTDGVVETEVKEKKPKVSKPKGYETVVW